jgi:hypothetical protein
MMVAFRQTRAGDRLHQYMENSNPAHHLTCSAQANLVKDPEVVGKFCFLIVVRAYPVVELLNLFSYRCQNWASTELVKIYLTTPKKSDLHQQTLNSLHIPFPQSRHPRSPRP